MLENTRYEHTAADKNDWLRVRARVMVPLGCGHDDELMTLTTVPAAALKDRDLADEVVCALRDAMRPHLGEAQQLRCPECRGVPRVTEPYPGQGWIPWEYKEEKC